MLDNFQVDGAIPITQQQVSEMMANMQSVLMTAIQNQTGTSSSASVLRTAQEFRGPGGLVIEGYRMWMWGGAMHMVPQNFVVPLCNSKTIFDLWFLGKPVDNMSPYKHLNPHDVNVKMRQRLSKCKYVMKQIISEIGMTTLELSELSVQERDAKFDTSYIAICTKLNPDATILQFDARRKGDMSYMTLYDSLKKYAKANANAIVQDAVVVGAAAALQRLGN